MRYHIFKNNRPVTFEKQFNEKENSQHAFAHISFKLYIVLFVTVSFKCTMIFLIECYF